MKHRIVVRQNRRGYDKPFIADQVVFMQPFKKYWMNHLIEVRVGRQFMLAVICGMGWEGNEFVINVL